MRDKNQKRLQKQINKVVRAMNENIYNDDLWLGRFYAHQIKSNYTKFDDGSGGYLGAWIEMVDRKTGQTKVTVLSTCGNDRFLGYEMWVAMNNFITQDCDVWKNEDENPYKNIVDYRRDKKC